jgi:uncharacterized membrane protein YkvI
MAACRIGFTYIGTVVGAGFASGQEIMQFFTRFGSQGIWGIAAVTLMFSWLGTRMMVMGARLKASSYEELNRFLFGPRWGKWMNGFVGMVLFGVTTAMMSGTGALFREQLGWSFHMGVILTAVVAFAVIVRGLDGILSVNSLIVPMMFLFTLLVAANGLGRPEAAEWLTASHHGGGQWWLSALTYVAFNLAMSQAVLVPMGNEVADERILTAGGWLGGVGLGVMLLASHFAMTLEIPEILRKEIPIAMVIAALGTAMKAFFLLVMWGEIFTTLIGNVYGLAAHLREYLPYRMNTIIAGIFISGYVCSLIGFPTFVGYVYPLFGYCGLAAIGLLALRPYPRW